LANNLFTGTLTNGIGALNQLQYLRVQGNNLSGPLPASIASLGALIELDLSVNNFVGALPSSYDNLTNLDTLLIYANALDRDASHLAIIPGSLASWFGALSLSRTENQRDVHAPTISSVDTI
jgi:hypothetical protein